MSEETSGSGVTSTEGSTSSQRISKACENCRAKKIKCSGDLPCKTCIASGKAATCRMRTKARPNRPLSAKVRRRTMTTGTPSAGPPAETLTTFAPEVSTRIEDGLAFLGTLFPPDPPLNYLPLASKDQPRVHPLDHLSEALGFWCISSGVSLEDLLFHDDTLVSTMTRPVLPSYPEIIVLEDRLIAHLYTAPDLDRLETVDKSNLFNLYSRYRVLPSTLTLDQKGLVYAALCSARANERKKGIGGTSREDVTYYHMALDAIKTWGRPSTPSLWALFCLVDYASGNGGAQEHCDLMKEMAWQMEGLGLHRRATVNLYPPAELTGPLAAAFFYQDSFRASLTDMRLLIPSSSVDVDVVLPDFWAPKESVRAAGHAAKFLQEFNDPTVDITSDAYLFGVEEEWSEALADLRRQRSTGTKRVKHAWGEIWYHWLRILLYLSRLHLSPGRASQAIMCLLRSSSNILDLYSELSDIGTLNPSWPQMKRIVICGQVLVLCCSRGEAHAKESAPLFERLLDLLDKHRSVWPSAEQSVTGFYQAANSLGIPLAMDAPSTSHVSTDLPNPDLWLGGDAELNWSGLFVDMAPTTFFGIGDSIQG